MCWCRAVIEVAGPGPQLAVGPAPDVLDAFVLDDAVSDVVGGSGVAQAVGQERGDVVALGVLGELDVVDVCAGQSGQRLLCAGEGVDGVDQTAVEGQAASADLDFPVGLPVGVVGVGHGGSLSG